MTRDKAQKQAIRARMAKTGERYTTARYYLLDLHHPELGDANSNSNSSSDEQLEADGPSPSLVEAVVAPSALAHDVATPVVEIALPPRMVEPGVSDAAVQHGTGRDWDEWFALLDAWDGTTHNHTEIARHVHEMYGIDGWWAQSVAVGYERARGMRALYERPDGFSVSASKTFPVQVERLFSAFVEQDEREDWLEGVELHLRTSQPHKSARFDVLPDGTRLAGAFMAKGPEKASAHLQVERLADAGDVGRWKAIWKAQLAFLASYLAEKSSQR